MFRKRILKQDEETCEMLSPLELKQSGSKGFELQLTQDELAKRMDELKSPDTTYAQAQGELSYLRRLVDDLNFRLNEAIDASKKDRLRANRMEIACFTAAEDWKVELEAMQNQHQVEISCLQKENEDLKHKVVGANKAEEVALRMAREAVLVGEDASKQVESLSIDLEKSRQETLECRRALVELAKQKTGVSEAYAASAQAGAAIVAEKEAELKKQMAALFQAKQQAEQLRWELFESRKTETSLCEMSNEIEIFKKQVASAKQIEEQQAKVLMDADAKLQEADFEVQQARTAKNEVATLLSLRQEELQEVRHKWMLVSSEVSALTANVESMKDELETQQMQIRMLQGRNAELEAKLLEASEKLAKSLTGEQKKDEALDYLACSLEAARLESQLLRQKIYEAVFDAQFGEVEIIKELMSIHIVLEVAECTASKARADLQDMLNELCSENELAVLGSTLRDSSGESVMEGLRTNRESLETIEADALLHDPLCLELALAACKPAALRIAFNLKVIREQLDRIREEAEILVAVMSDSSSYHQEKEQASEEALDELDKVRVEALKKIASSNQFQENFNKESVLDANVEVQWKFRELSEPWEMVDSGREANVTIKKEEYDALKHRVHEAMEVESITEAQLLSLKGSNQRLLTQLDATNVEIKGLRLSEQSMFQQYDKLQQHYTLLEAEMQSVKGKDEQFFKSWGSGSAASGLDANVLHSPQSMKFDNKLQHTSSSLSISRDLSSSEKEEESTEFLSLSSKKKKKGLYLRIGTFLTKKRN